MKKTGPFSPQLIAPCGMNCAICSRYLSHLNDLKRSKCIGCRPGNKQCDYLFEKCTGINNVSKGNTSFCFECEQYPCKEIKRMDKRYRKNYKMSVIENLETIRRVGVEKLIEQQYEKYCCQQCGGLISIHNKKCFKCEPITRLIEKSD